jgi:putative oxidoreductase
MKTLRLVLCILFGGLFIFSGVLKVRDPSMFLLNVRSFNLLGDPYAAWLALFLPWLEIFCGLAVVTGICRRAGLLLLNAALVLFLAAIVQAWARGINIECGCFGPGDKASNYVELILRDLVLLAVGGWLTWQPRPRESGCTPDQT